MRSLRRRITVRSLRNRSSRGDQALINSDFGSRILTFEPSFGPPFTSGFDGPLECSHVCSMSATESPVDIGTLITRTPGIKRGSPHIAGTGVLVRTIARWHQMALSPEEIVAKYGFLRLDQVHAALAYYYANRLEIDRELQRIDDEADKLEAAARQA